MGGIDFSVHPLFFAVGFYYALTGKIFEFCIYVCTAVLHEIGHSIAAERAGYRLKKITLMPFGAVAFGDVRGLAFSDEVFIAAAGPLINLAIGLFFVAMWWIFPELYAFTDTAAEANFVLALINLIPAYPLDGGRILSASLSAKFGRERAILISKRIGIGLAVLLAGGFVFTLFYTPNFSLLLFAAFVFVGAASRKTEAKLVRMDRTPSSEALKRGLPVKRQALSKKATVKTLLKITDGDAINEIDIYDGERRIAKLDQKKITQILQSGEVYATLEKFL